MSENLAPDSFLGRGWAFPPRFAGRGAVMVAAADDIRESLRILFATVAGERPFAPGYGLDLRPVLFEPLSTTLRTLLLDRIRTAILIHEPRIRPLTLSLEVAEAGSGTLELRLDYEIRATNSRYNLVHPFYRSDGNELGATLGGAGG